MKIVACLVYSCCTGPCEFIIRNANNVHIVFKRKEAGNETVSFNDAGVSPVVIFLEEIMNSPRLWHDSTSSKKDCGTATAW